MEIGRSGRAWRWGGGVIVAMSLLLGGCGGEEAEPVSEAGRKWIVQLRGGTPTEREEAAAELAALNEKGAIQPLCEALSDTQIRVRLAAANALGRIGDASATASLSEALKDPSFRVRMAAAAALGRIGDPAAIQPLVETMLDEEPAVRLAAAEALGRFGDQAVVPLQRIYEQGDLEKRAAAIYALGKTRSSKATDLVMRAAKEGRHPVRLSAAAALGELGDDRAIDLLTEMIDSPLGEADRVAFEAARQRALTDAERGRIEAAIVGERSEGALPYGHNLPHVLEGQRRDIERAAERLRSDARPPVDREAMQWMIIDRIGEGVYESLSEAEREAEMEEQVRLVLEATERETVDGEVQPLSVGQLQQVRQMVKAVYLGEDRKAWSRRKPDERERLIRRRVEQPVEEAEREAAASIRAAACVALGRIDSQASARRLIELLGAHGGDRDGREVAGWCRSALREMGVSAVQPMKEAIDDATTSSRVRDDLIDMLTDRARKQSEAVAAMVDLLDSENGQARRAAAEALEQISDPGLVSPLIDAARSPDPRVRRMVVEIVGGVGNPFEEPVVNTVIEALSDEDRTVVREAARHAGRMGDLRAAERLLDLLRGSLPSGEGEGDAELVEYTTASLGELGVGEASGLVREVLELEGDAYRKAVDAAIVAAGKLGDRDAVKRLVELGYKGKWERRHRVADALGNIGDPRGLDYLVDMAKPDRHVEKSAIPAIGGIATKEATDALVRILKTGRESFKKLAVKGLLRQGEHAVGAMRKLLLEGRDEADRAAGAQVLAGLGEPGVKALIEGLSHEKEHVVKSALHGAAVYAMLKTREREGTSRLVEAAIAITRRDSTDLRAAACYALGQLGGEEAKRRLTEVSEGDGEEAVRGAAKSALAAIRQAEQA